MKKHLVCFAIFALWAASFSQNAYQKCVQECLAAGGDLATCTNEICNPADTQQTVVSGQGNPLYLPSYLMKGPAPVIDGSLMSRDGDPSTSDAMDEWKEACSRTLLLNDSTPVQLFLMNTLDTLYVGMTYQDIDNSNGCGERLLFDQGNNVPPSQYHGSTDMKLTAPGGICNETGCSIYKAGSSYDMHDLCWNGTSWIDDGDGQLDFRAASQFFNTSVKVHHYEYAIPLHNGKVNNSSNSDLNVNFDDAIGFYLEVKRGGAYAGTYNWIETNGNPNRVDTFPFWGKIQLSVQRDYFTFYTGRGSNPPPTLDGSINEAVWNGAYQRELILSNFHYNAIRSKIWCLEDSAQNFIYIGLRVYDKTPNAGDYCQIYFEEDGTNTTNPVRNYILDNNAESALRTTNASQFSDYYWNASSSAWTAVAAADLQGAKAGQTAQYADYEFKVQRSGGSYHIDIPKAGLLGLLIRYHDADRTGTDLSTFFWEYTTNNDAQLLDNQSSPPVYIATGWANLQLGGPYIQVVTPASGDNIHGVVPVQVSSGTDSLSSVVCFLSTDTMTRTSLSYQGNGTWTGSIDATNAPAGTMLVIRAVAANGTTYERIVNKADTSAVLLPPPSESRKVFGAAASGLSAKGLNFLVTLEKRGSFVLEVYSVSGRKVWARRVENAAAGQNKVGFDGPALGNGTYLLMLNRGNERIAQKFTVVR
jgi:hypothetical protein